MRNWIGIVGLTWAVSLYGRGEGPILVHDGSIASVETFQGAISVKSVPVAPKPEITIVMLGDTFANDDLLRVRRALAGSLDAEFLSGAPTRILWVAGSTGEMSSTIENPAKLQDTLKRAKVQPAPVPGAAGLLATLAGIAPTVPGGWADTIIIGRLPSQTTDTTWISSWIGEAYRKQRARVSFWMLDGACPDWARNLSASTSGLVSTSDFEPILQALNGVSEFYFEITWQTKLHAGGRQYPAEFRNVLGEGLLTVDTFAAAPDFAPSFQSYFAARAAMLVAPDDNEITAQQVLKINAIDADALRRLARIYELRKNAKEASGYWKTLTSVLPRDATVWLAYGSSAYSAQDLDEAERALSRVAELGNKTQTSYDLRARIHFRKADYQGTLPLLDQALTTSNSDQELWLMRADCGQRLGRWGIQAESLERAIALGHVPFDRRTELIAGYLAHHDLNRALPHLKAATGKLPRDAAIQCAYANFWNEEPDSGTAEKLFASAIEIDPKYELGYIGLAQKYLDGRRTEDGLRVADQGLGAVPDSAPLLLFKEDALEHLGDIYGARRVLNNSAIGNGIELLRRRARLEDWHGDAAFGTYSELFSALEKQHAPTTDLIQVCQRGVYTALRSEQYEVAGTFAQKMAALGDKAGMRLVTSEGSTRDDTTDLPGGASALQFLLTGNDKASPASVLLDYSRILAGFAENKPEFLHTAEELHRFFQHVSALAALGEKKNGKYEVVLSLLGKADKQRTEKVFSILGLKTVRKEGKLSIESAEGKSQSKKQDTLASLAIDDQEIQVALNARKPYTIDIPVDQVSVFPPESLWRRAFYAGQHYAGGIAEAFLNNPRLPQLYLALNSMDRGAAEEIIKKVPLPTLADLWTGSLVQFSAALAVDGNRAEVPGGVFAYSTWQRLAGADPANAVEFFQALLRRDEGRLIAFFYTLSELDMPHQRFFTRSFERTHRFYDLFRDSGESRRAAGHRLSQDSFLEFLREVPLNDDGTVDFPGAPEVWMVAKGNSKSTSAAAKMNKKLRRAAAPDDEDSILIRLAATAYKGASRQESELANFVAVARLDAQRTEPLTPEAALLLAQSYSSFGGLYLYLGSLGDLDANDFQRFFALAARFEGGDTVLDNLRLGQLHSWLAMLCAAGRNGAATAKQSVDLFRKGVERYSSATDASSWTLASLSALDELANLRPVKPGSRDAAIRMILLGERQDGAVNVGSRAKAYEDVLAMQKVPSLDALFAMRDSLNEIGRNASVIGEISRNTATLTVIAPQKSWKLEGHRKKLLEQYQTGDCVSFASKLREKLAKRKRNDADIEKLKNELLGSLEPWTELAMAGQIYARYLSPSDLLVSDDPMLLRKHEFIGLDATIAKNSYFPVSDLDISSNGEGSYFVGGFAQFSIAAGRARAAGNHAGGAAGEAFATAMFASVRATDWNLISPSALQSFAGTVRLAREWIVESGQSTSMRKELEQETLGLLSLSRRKTLLTALNNRDWRSVWECLSISDMYFTGDALIEHAPSDLWRSPELRAMKTTASQSKELGELGQVAPDLSGSGAPQLRRYEPYEEYQRYMLPDHLAQRTAELKLYLAYAADSLGLQPSALAEMAPRAADAAAARFRMRDMWDWSAALDAYRELQSDTMKGLVNSR